VNNQTPVGLDSTSTLNDILSVAGKTVPGILTRSTDKPYRKVTIKTTPEQDRAVEGAILRNLLDPPDYKLYHNDCAAEVSNILVQGGMEAPNGDIRPQRELNDLSEMYKVPIVNY
jgi:poly-gamma-glutamate capsule biosynthesis protein CapA/YwtB (metallophosphatase superfamily)